MIAFAYYMLKTVLCAGILYGYYLLALRDRVFHIWNRYFLLATVVLSLTLPVIKIPLPETSATVAPTAVRFVEAASSGDRYVRQMDEAAGWHISTEQWVGLAYILVGLLFLTHLIAGLARIRQLLRKHAVLRFGDIGFVLTREKGTPFSFWRYIFWHEDVNVDSDMGRQMLKHEMVHVREGHTFDRLFLNAALVIGWCNPFLWLIRKEMEMIHEFIADSRSVEDGDTASFAAMILQSAYPGKAFPHTHSFFHSPIKRRLRMLIKNRNPRTGYITRIMALPLAALVFAAFTLRPVEAVNADMSDAGRTNLALSGTVGMIEGRSLAHPNAIPAKPIGDTSPVKVYPGMTFLMETDDPGELDSLRKLLVVIGDKRYTAADIVNFEIAADSVAFYEKNDPDAVRIFGEAGRNGVLKFINPKSLVMKAPEKELTLMGLPRSYHLTAGDTLPESGRSTIRLRGVSAGSNPLIVIDGKRMEPSSDIDKMVNTENIATINVLKGKAAETLYGSDGRNGVIQITTKKGSETVVVNGQEVPKKIENIVMGQPLELNAEVNGYLIKEDGAKKIMYFQKGAGNSIAEQEPAFTKVETAPVFPESGGDVNAWLKGLAKSIEKKADGLKGTCKVRFIVERSGRPTSFSIVNEKTTNLNLAYWVLESIKEGPNWKPGMQNGEAVAVVQELTFKY